MRYLLFLLVLFAASPAEAERRDAPADYHRFFKNGECSPAAFELARSGYEILKADGLLQQPRYLTIIDYTHPSNKRRLFVLDMEAKHLLLTSIVSHGVGSDPDSSAIPYRFGNWEGSKMSSLGFYLTGDVYTNFRPRDSLGLCLFGLDKGYNDSAAAREIVFHYGATEYTGRVYVTDSGAARSYGCPALPLSTNGRVIRLIKGGSLLFVYSGKAPAYVRRSTVLNRQLKLPVIQQGPPPNNCSCHISQPAH